MEQSDDRLVRQNSSNHLHFAIQNLIVVPSGAVPPSQDQKFHLSNQNQMSVAKIHFECPCISVTAVQPVTQNETSHHH